MIIKIQQKIYYFFFFILINIYNYSKKYSLREKILLKGRKYLIRCLKDRLNKKIYSKIINPRVTVVIPVYTIFNEFKTNHSFLLIVKIQ